MTHLRDTVDIISWRAKEHRTEYSDGNNNQSMDIFQPNL